MSATGRALSGLAPAPASTASTRSEHFRELARGRSAAYAAVLGGALVFVAGAARQSPALMGLGPVVCLALVAGVCFALAIRRAETDFFAGYAASLGLRHRSRGVLPALLPLLSAGDSREAQNVLEGEVAGQPLTLAHYSFKVHSERLSSRDDEPVTERRAFTVCVMPVAAPPGLDAGVFLHDRRGILDRLTEKDWLRHAGAEHVALESSAFAERFELRAAPGTEALALRQLFAPSFLSWIAEHPLAPAFEYQAGVLVVFVESELDDGGTLTFFLDAARWIAARFAARTVAAGDR